MRSLVLGVLLLACTPLMAAVEKIDNDQLQKLMAQGVPVIDIRRPEEWKQTGVIEGSHLITFFDKKGGYDVTAWLQQFDRIVAGRNDPFILICRTGNRTGVVSKFLSGQLGYARVYDVKQGITQWIREGRPVVKP